MLGLFRRPSRSATRPPGATSGSSDRRIMGLGQSLNDAGPIRTTSKRAAVASRASSRVSHGTPESPVHGLIASASYSTPAHSTPRAGALAGKRRSRTPKSRSDIAVGSAPPAAREVRVRRGPLDHSAIVHGVVASVSSKHLAMSASGVGIGSRATPRSRGIVGRCTVRPFHVQSYGKAAVVQAAKPHKRTRRWSVARSHGRRSGEAEERPGEPSRYCAEPVTRRGRT